MRRAVDQLDWQHAYRTVQQRRRARSFGMRSVSFLLCALVLSPGHASERSAPRQAVHSTATTATRVVLLGTGTPNADPERSGPAVAIIVGGAAYLVDAGPGVRRAALAARDDSIPELTPP